METAVGLPAPGPLLYHYEDMGTEASLELTYAELRSVIQAVGFELEVRAPRAPVSPLPLRRRA